MKWKLERIDWHSEGLCWKWTRVTKHVYYSGNQVQIQWGRIAFVFERRVWIHVNATVSESNPVNTMGNTNHSFPEAYGNPMVETDFPTRENENNKRQK